MNQELFDEITQWQKETFGVQFTPLSKIAHLAEEIQELVADLQENSPYTRLEYADCFILLFGSAAANGMTYEDICNAINEKMIINKARKWGKPNEQGVVNHIKEAQVSDVPERKYTKEDMEVQVGDKEAELRKCRFLSLHRFRHY